MPHQNRRASPIVALTLTLTVLTALATAAAPATANAQPAQSAAALVSRPHAEMPSVSAARRTGSVQVDGRLDEPAWQAATPVTQFIQLDPAEGQPATERTEARILVDDDAIYVGMRLFDSDPGAIQAQLARRDEPIDGDIVEVTFDSYHDHLSGFIFRLSPLGARRDAAIAANGNQDNSWDAVWDGSATMDSLGWSAEFRIPLSQLRFDPNQAEQSWGLQLSRKITRKAELIFFAFTPKAEQQGVNRYGHLTGLGRLASRRRLELVPYALAKNQHPGVAPDDPFRTKNDMAVGGGLDLRYGITSNLTLDATFNPDFGQVEVDPAVVNLSAFETFFPERRPFFVEGASIFRFGSMRTQNQSNSYTFLHSRRIGRSPQRSLDGPDHLFVDAPLETTIAAAAKVTGRTRNGWSIGLLDAATLREEARFQDATGAAQRTTVEPAANYFMGRIKRDIRQGNTTLGAALTAVNRDLGEPALDERFRSAAYVGGFDWNHAWSDRGWAFDGAILASHNRGSPAAIEALQLSSARYYQRPDQDRSRRAPGKESLTGYLGEVTFAKISGAHWRGTVTYQEYSPGFEINEAGFLGSTDMRSLSPLISYTENRPGKYLRSWEQYLFWNPTWNFDGDMTFNGVGAITFVELPSFWRGNLRLDWRPPVFDSRFTRGGPVARAVSGGGVNGEIASDRRKRHTYGVFGNYNWNAAGGWERSIGSFVTFRPSTAIRVNLNPNYSRTHAVAQYVTQVEDPTATTTFGSRYVFAALDQHELALVTRVDWTFTPGLSLQVFAQPLISVGDFEDYKEFTRPRSYDFAVYGRDAGTISRDASGEYTVDPDGAGAAAPFTFDDEDFNSRSLRGSAVLRWEYRPGSALFVVWQQSRSGNGGSPDFALRRDFDELWRTRPENVFVIKATWWMGR